MTISAIKPPNSLTSSNQPTAHAVIVLAAGLSTRLRTAKQLLLKDGQPLIKVMVIEALKTNPAALIVVSQNQSLKLSGALSAISTLSESIKIVINPNPASGMGQSLSLGIDVLKTFAKKSEVKREIKRVLILGIDQVCLDIEHLNQLLAINKPLVVSTYPADCNSLTKSCVDNQKVSDEIMGLPIAIDCDQLIAWQDHISGDQGLRALIRQSKAQQIAKVNQLKLCYDIDTKSQLIFAQENGWLDQ